MKFNTKFAIALVAAATSVFGLASNAMAAGAGGAAGAAAFTINGAAVTGVAVAAAVGKNEAVAAAFNNPSTTATGVLNSAYAIGTGGTVNLAAIGDPATAAITSTAEATATLTVVQANVLSDVANVTIGTATGNNIVTLP